VCDDELIDRVFEFRYKILLDIYPEYLNVSGYSGTKEHDKYDKYSVHFAALNEDGEVCATVRLIHHSPIGYPTENSMTFDNSMFERDRLGEMSRIFIDDKYRNLKTTKYIIQNFNRLLYFKMMELGIEYTYGSLEDSFLRLLRIYKMNYQTIGEKQAHEYFGKRYPSILYTERLGLDNPEILRLHRSSYEV
jgi:N-acyl-L-homoserine lactone synthetase